MSPHGIVQCQVCNKEFEGELPNNKLVGAEYSSLKDNIDRDFVVKLQKHHSDTADMISADGDTFHGHRDYKIWLDNGDDGELNANSYAVTYKLRGKER